MKQFKESTEALYPDVFVIIGVLKPFWDHPWQHQTNSLLQYSCSFAARNATKQGFCHKVFMNSFHGEHLWVATSCILSKQLSLVKSHENSPNIKTWKTIRNHRLVQNWGSTVFNRWSRFCHSRQTLP